MNFLSCGLINYSIVGLILDVVGVCLLGFDLIRLQRSIRLRGKEGRARFDDLESKYGGIEFWADDLKDQSRFTLDYGRSSVSIGGKALHHTDEILEIVSNLALTVNGLAAQLTSVAGILRSNAVEDDRLASISLKFSVLGIAFLVAGFSLQIVGMACL